MTNKVKIEKLVSVTELLEKVLPEVNEKFAGKDISALLGLTKNEAKRLEKKLTEATETSLKSGIRQTLLAGDSVEVADTLNIFVHESEVNLGENGLPKKKLSLKTRKAMKEDVEQAAWSAKK